MACHDSTLTIEDLRLEELRLRKGLISHNTVLGYGHGLRMYRTWCERFHREALPTSTETLCLYLTSLLTEGKKITTARRRKCAVLYAHRAQGLTCPDGTEAEELLRGAQRLRAEKPRRMRPITVQELRRMSAGLARAGTTAAMRNRALLVLGFATALRRANLAALKLADVEFVRQGLIVNVDREKNDQQGHGRRIGVLRGRHANSDPVRVLRAWLRLRGGAPGPLFPRVSKFRRGEQLDGECVCRVVKKSLAAIGVDPIQSGAHSLRAGTVTAMGEANVGVLRISTFTGQSPQMVERYFRRSEMWRNNASGTLGL